jgi:hypothetical protein
MFGRFFYYETGHERPNCPRTKEVPAINEHIRLLSLYEDRAEVGDEMYALETYISPPSDTSWP